MPLLAIETSCDETAVALVGAEGELVAQITETQAKLHQRFRGVVPEVAARAHSTVLLPLIDRLLEQTKLGYEAIDAVAVTNGPGLLGALLVGQATAKALALALGKPLIAVDHIAAHVFSPFVEKPKSERFPIL